MPTSSTDCPSRGERVLTSKEVRARTLLSDTQLDHAITAGDFPPPRRVSPSRFGWLESEVDQWLRTREILEVFRRSEERKTGRAA